MGDDKWNEFLKSGSVLAYLSYVAEQNKTTRDEQKGENSNSGINNQGNQYR